MKIVKNQTERIEFTFTNESGYVDLTGSTVYFTIEDLDGNEVYSQEKTSFSNPTSGIIIITIPRSETAAFNTGSVKIQVAALNTSDEKVYSVIYSGQIIDTLNL